MTTSSSYDRRKKRKKGGQDDGWEQWGGYMPAKIQKLEEQFVKDLPIDIGHKGESSDIFKGISIFVNGYTKPTSDELKKLMIVHGGRYCHYYSRSKVTHIIASNLPNSKVDKINDKKIVKPEWITESIDAKKLLPYQSYLLYTAKSNVQPGMMKFATSITQNKTKLEDVRNENVQVNKNRKSDDEKADDTSIEREKEQRQDSSFLKADESTPEKNKINSKVENTTIAKEDVQSASTSTSSKLPKSKPMARAGDPTFVKEFYDNSRLHYLSTWGAEFRAYVNELQNKGDTSFPAREILREAAAVESADKDKESVDGSTAFKTSSRGKPERVLMHVDMDSFFVSVGLKNRPDLIGKPVAVTHSKGNASAKVRAGTDLEYEKDHYRKRGLKAKKGPGKGQLDLERNPDLLKMQTPDDNDREDADSEDLNEFSIIPTTTEAFNSMAEIASCSYEARNAGVKNGMFMGKAKQLCPDLITIPYDFDGYKQVSQQLYDIVANYTHDIEAVSCDEMLVDCTDLLADTGISPLGFATILRQRIKDTTGCNASVGMGPNILLARMATRVAKPNGQYFVDAGKAMEFIKDKNVKDLPGVGYAMRNKLMILNVSTCLDLQGISSVTLQKEFGPKTGQSLYKFCRGQDDRPIRIERERKSVSAEINYGIRFTQESDVDKFLNELAEEVHNRLVKIKLKGKTITMKVKVRKEGAPKETAKFMGHGICDNITKSVTIPMATDDAKVIAKECLGILRPLKIQASEYRGIGIQMSKLESPIGASSHGTQSILNFTTASKKQNEEGNKTETRISPIKAPHTTSSNTATTSDMPKPKPREMPALPSLPSFDSMKSPDTSKAIMEAKTPSVTLETEDSYLPSPSQVDHSVLHALPASIRLEVEKAMNEKKMKKSKSIRTPAGDRDPEAAGSSTAPGCSHWSESKHKDDDPIVALPSYSQVDKDCFAALPKELQKEFQDAYARENSKEEVEMEDLVVPEPPMIHPLMNPELRISPKKSPKKSPEKSRSPKGRGTTSPHFKVPKGKPGRKKKNLSPKKLNFVSTEKSGSRQNTNKPQTISSDSSNVNTVEDDSYKESTNKTEDMIMTPVGPNLCGAVFTKDVKELLLEWINSSPVPEDTDVERFLTYMYELANDKNLERMDLLIKFLNRQVKKIYNEEWTRGFAQIVNRVQEIVKNIYGHELKLNF